MPVFFVLMGMRVDLPTFGDLECSDSRWRSRSPRWWGSRCAGWVSPEKGADQLAVGLGMIPRGEVGLIFAGIGATLTIQGARVIDAAVYSAVVLMVAATTLVTPPLLAWRLRGRK